MRMVFRSTAALAIGGMLLIGCDGEDSPDEEPTDPVEETEDDGAAEESDATEDDDAEASEDEASEEGSAGPAGTVTLDGVTVELDEAFWCEDYTSAAGQTEMRIVGIAHGMIKLDAGAYLTDDGTALDAVTIWQAEELDRGLGGTQVVGVEEGADGYPWIEVDGTEVTIDGSYRGEDDPDDVDEAVFSADLTVEEEPRGSAQC